MSIVEYEHYKNTFLNTIQEYQYIFELRKCCGYKEWMLIYKSKTLQDLYDNLYCQLKVPTNRVPPIKLYLVHNEEKIEVEKDKTLLYDYICSHQNYLKAIYPLPCKVVYPLYIDDGSCHDDHRQQICHIHNETVELK